MKTAIKKALVFGVIITLFTSAYAAFLNTIMKQEFLSRHFLQNWLRLIPKTYILLLPFVLITGPLIKLLVERVFKEKKDRTVS